MVEVAKIYVVFFAEDVVVDVFVLCFFLLWGKLVDGVMLIRRSPGLVMSNEELKLTMLYEIGLSI